MSDNPYTDLVKAQEERIADLERQLTEARAVSVPEAAKVLLNRLTLMPDGMRKGLEVLASDEYAQERALGETQP